MRSSIDTFSHSFFYSSVFMECSPLAERLSNICESLGLITSLERRKCYGALVWQAGPVLGTPTPLWSLPMQWSTAGYAS
jgi:hypothetical protein